MKSFRNMPDQNKKLPDSIFSDKPDIYFHSEDTSYILKSKRLIKDWIINVIELEEKIPVAINVILVSDNYLYDLNVSYLGHDTLTDVITFDYSVDNQISGDVYISIERVKDNAKELHVRVYQELNRVIIHGILHLLGHNDKSSQQLKVMRAKEDKCLSLLADMKNE